MILENGTEFPVAWIPGRLQYPAHSLTIIVKATFDLSAEGTLRPAQDQSPIGPELEEDGAEGGALCYDLDLVEHKPRADRLLVGKCHVPEGRPTTECQVGFSVGNWQRRLRVVGDRTWKKGLLQTRATDPQPFTEMELSYSRAYGGPRFAANPSGRGFYKGKPECDREICLPNIEDPVHPIKSPSDLIAPASFGPVSRAWPPRRNLIGTYGKAWFKSRSPWFPEDIDWGVNNSTPLGGQTDGYLRGDEPFVLENLWAKRARVEGRLPGLCLRAAIERVGDQGVLPEEVPLNLDTLWIDTESGKLVLIWRGACTVESEEFEDLATLILVQEQLDGARSSVQDLLQPLRTQREEEAAAVLAEAAEEESDTGPEAEEEGEFVEPGESDEAVEARRRSLIQSLQKSLDRLPTGADALPEQVEAREEVLRVIAKLEAPPADEPPAPPPPVWSREAVISTIEALRTDEDSEAESTADSRVLAGADLSGLDLSELDFSGLDLSGAILEDANLTHSDCTETDLTDVAASRVEATGADFTDARGLGARFCDARLQRAKFCGASVSESDFSGADLSGANLEAANFTGCQFSKSKLDRVQADGVDFSGATLDGSTGSRSHFEGASFEGASLVEVQFFASYLGETSCEGSSWTRAQLSQCDLTKANFTKADLSSAVVTSARAGEAAFVKARLDGTSFSESDLDEANFTRAFLRQTDLTAASLCRANFRRAQIEGSVFQKANLFEALFPAAKLDRVDFRNSNLYGADLSEIEARELRIEGAIVKQTRLDPN